MKGKGLMLLAVIAVAALGVALSLDPGGPSPDAAVAEDELLVPGLLEAINEVNQLQIAPAGAPSVTLTRNGSDWSVREAHSYPANMKAVRAALLTLADARLLEPKTQRPENYAKLGVEDPESEGASGMLLTLTSDEGVLAELIVGRYEGRSRAGTYVRRAGEAQSYLVSGELTLERDPVEWLLREVLHVDAAEVNQVTVMHADGEQLMISKQGEQRTNFDLLDVPADREASSPAAGNALGGALNSLRLDGVYPAADVDLDSLEPLRATFELFDGRVYQVAAAQREGEALLHLAGRFDREQAEAQFAAAQAEAEAETAAAAESTDNDPQVEPVATPDFEQIEADAARINERLGAWVFVVPEVQVRQPEYPA